MQYETKNRINLGAGNGGWAVRTDGIDAESTSPNVLMVYWELYSRTQQWFAARTIAEAMVSEFPGLPVGWLHRSLALYRLGRIAAALAGLEQAAERFPGEWRIAYNAAGCCCQLGDVAGAWDWLDQAIGLGNADVIKSSALDDPDFRPLWERLGRI